MAIELLRWLRSQGTSLAECRQDHLDLWLDARTSRTRFEARPFVQWAVRTKRATKISIPVMPRERTHALPLDADERWTLARRLLHDDTLDDRDRVAGALVLLCAQKVTNVAALTVGHRIHQ